MKIDDLKEKLVAVLGYGQEGKAVAEYLIKHGIKPVLFDQKPWEEWPASEQEAIKKLEVNFIFGPDAFLELAGFDVAFRSPGIPLGVIPSAAEGSLNAEKVSAIRDSSSDALLGMTPKKRGMTITSQTKWFFEHCPAKIIGITGTKGKGTTSSLIFEMLQARTSHLEPRTYLTGNIGKTQPLEILDNLTEDDWVIYELSSFQLQDLEQSPHIAVILMVTSEHLDYHKDIKEYHDAKTAITKYQTKEDFAIINQDFPASKTIGSFGKGRKLFFSRKKVLKNGCFVKDNEVVVPSSNFQYPISNILLKGPHNLENICAAILAAKTAGATDNNIKQVLKKFKGLEHRLEFVAEKKGIKFYNDSFSTTPETAIAAINSFTEPEVLILGGSSKNSDFAELAQTVSAAKNIKSVILIGQEAGRIKDAISKTSGYKGKILEGAANMGEIFNQIKSLSTKGDVVLLSPACASFDMFKSYVDRGEQFKNLVKSF